MVFVFCKTHSRANPWRSVFTSEIVSRNGQGNDDDIVFAFVVVEGDEAPFGQQAGGMANAVGQLDVVGDVLLHFFDVARQRRAVRFFTVFVDVARLVRTECGNEFRKRERFSFRRRSDGVEVSGQESAFVFGQPHGRASLEQANDQVHRARGPTKLTFEQPKSVNEGADLEKPKDERAPVQRLVYARHGRDVIG